MKQLSRPLLRWYDQHARDLPWRRTSDPYAIWISEVMLQQTQVETVKPYFERFHQRFPRVRDLAAADESEVLRLWEGLGYYRRARQLHAASRRIAFDQRQPILEGNTIRVYSRLLGYRSDPRSTAGQRELWQFAEAILPKSRVGAFNQAMMELGSEVCVPKRPDCASCPLMASCRAREHGWQDQIPIPPQRKTKYEDVTEVAVVVRRRGRVLIRQCGPNERWAGMWDFPRLVADGDHPSAVVPQVTAMTGVEILLGTHVTTIKHAVTRFRITLKCYDAEYVSGRLRRNGGCRWVAPGDLSGFALSVTGRKLANRVQSTNGELV
jgi:A/G-specific adenine glycosylase